MKGIVIGVNRRLGRVIIECEDGELTIAEADNLELHEVVYGPLDEHAGVTLRTESGERNDVFIEGIQCAPSFARGFLDGRIN